MLKLTTDRQEALRGICATVELVFIPNLHSSPPVNGIPSEYCHNDMFAEEKN